MAAKKLYLFLFFLLAGFTISGFTTAFAQGTDPVIVAAGDNVCGANSTSASCRQMATSDLFAGPTPALEADAVLALGDVQYEFGEYANFLNYFDPSWGRAKAKLYPAIGNHEYGDSVGSSSTTPDCDVLASGDPRSYACGYFDYFNGKGNLTGRAGERGKGYYSFKLGNWWFYAINSNCSRSGAPGCAVGSPQEQWLRKELAAHAADGQCQLIFAHHPYITSDERDHLSSPRKSFDTAELEPLLQAFYDYGGDVMLAGHSHFYERFAPIKPGPVQNVEVYPFNGTRFKNISDPTLDNVLGIRQFIVGTGGRNVYIPDNMTPKEEYPDPDGDKLEQFSLVHNAQSGVFGVLKMVLHSNSYDWQFVPSAGSTFTDSGSSSCHDAPGAPTPTPTLTSTTKPGDANGDGKVDETDYGIWLSHFGQIVTGGVSVGDFDGNGKVDGIDYSLWLKYYGT